MALKINKQTWVQMKAQSNQGMNIPKSPSGYNQNNNNNNNNQITGSAF